MQTAPQAARRRASSPRQPTRTGLDYRSPAGGLGGLSKARGLRESDSSAVSGAPAAAALARHEKAVRRRAERYKLRELLWDFSTIRRCRFCGRIAAKGKRANPRTPELRVADGVAHFAGVARCGSVWACPVCSAHIRQQRAIEVDAGMRTWIEQGNGVLFLTLTLPHGVGDSCHELMETIKAGWAATFTGRPWRRTRDEHCVRWWFRSWDATHGVNGWHPHVHAALFVEGGVDRGSIQRLTDELYERWAHSVELRGHKRPSREHGIHLEAARSAVVLSRYLLKVAGQDGGAVLALELTRGDLKTGPGRTPFQVLATFHDTGDTRELELFQEWERATKGQHFARWSNGARTALGISARSDEEIVGESKGGETLHAFTPDEWIALCRTRGAQGRVLAVAESCGHLGIRAFLDHLVGEWRRNARSEWRDSIPETEAA